MGPLWILFWLIQTTNTAGSHLYSFFHVEKNKEQTYLSFSCPHVETVQLIETATFQSMRQMFNYV